MTSSPPFPLLFISFLPRLPCKVNYKVNYKQNYSGKSSNRQHGWEYTCAFEIVADAFFTLSCPFISKGGVRFYISH